MLIEALLVFGLALVFGLRELRNLRRYDRERAARAKAANDAAQDDQGLSP